MHEITAWSDHLLCIGTIVASSDEKFTSVGTGYEIVDGKRKGPSLVHDYRSISCNPGTVLRLPPNKSYIRPQRDEFPQARLGDIDQL
jgi:hypothetical protein